MLRGLSCVAGSCGKSIQHLYNMSKRKKETWDEFEKRVGGKRQGKDKNERALNVPNDILVQRMSSSPSGRLKKYEPLDTRDFVPFAEYDELAVDNIKEACERFYNAPTGSCDILASDRGPSCSKMEQLKGKKVFFVRFLPPKEDRTAELGGTNKRPASSPAKPSSDDKRNNSPKTIFPKSVAITDLLKAGKLIKPAKSSVLSLEYFDVQNSTWIKANSPITLQMEPDKFASGAFRDAFKAKCSDQTSLYRGEWVVKKYQAHAIKNITEILSMQVEDHTRKQVQMHAVARSITAVFTSKVPEEFGETFTFSKIYYSNLEGQHVTVEEFVPGTFHKYVNNDGTCVVCANSEYKEIYEKAQCLSHFSYMYTDEKLMLLDLQGSRYRLYDPEISTLKLFAKDNSDEESNEIYFCAGNLSSEGIDGFIRQHKCNKFCILMDLKTL